MKNRPVVTIKYAQTLDGKIADRKGRSRWISGPEALEFAHKLRSQHQAVLVGVNTIIKDDPLLTVRLVKGNNPVRVIVDSKLRIPLKAKVVQQRGNARTIIATTSRAPETKVRLLCSQGAEILFISKNKKGKVDLRKLLGYLYKLKIKSVLVEGGSKVITSFLKERLVDKLIVIIAPKILGKGLEAIGDLGISDIDKSFKLKLKGVEKLGSDLVIRAKMGNK